MRTSILSAAFLGLFAIGCAGELTDTGGGDDVQPPENCGNGVTDSDETCDDGNTVSGDGCSSTCTTEQSTTPSLNVTVDKTTVDTELAKSEVITLNLQSEGGFAETVSITAALVDQANQPITALTVMGPTSSAVAADQTTPLQFTVAIPTDATGTDLVATLKLEVISSLGRTPLTSTINVAPNYTIPIAAGTGADNPTHPLAGKTLTFRRGAKLRMLNSDTVEHISHGGGGIPHEPVQPGVTGQPGATYQVDTTPLAPGGGRTFGCHTHGTATYANITLL